MGMPYSGSRYDDFISSFKIWGDWSFFYKMLNITKLIICKRDIGLFKIIILCILCGS